MGTEEQTSPGHSDYISEPAVCLRNFFNFEKRFLEAAAADLPRVPRILLDSVTTALEKVHSSRNSCRRAGPH